MSDDLERDKQLEQHKHTLERELEILKDGFARNLDQYRATQDIHLASFKATMEYGVHAARGALLLNGAAAIALMTFLGSSRPTSPQIEALAMSLAMFAIGALVAVCNFATSYLAQAFFTLATRNRKDHSWMGYVFQGVGILTFVISTGLFVCGIWRAAKAFAGNLTLSTLFGGI